MVIPFWLTNALASFQNFINDVLVPFLDRFVTPYLDDILIYSDMLEKHHCHICSVLVILSKERLHLKLEKPEFHQEEVRYLQLVLGKDRMKIDFTKVTAVSDRSVLKWLFNVRSFVGFADFYQSFISGFSSIVQPLSVLTRKEFKFT